MTVKKFISNEELSFCTLKLSIREGQTLNRTVAKHHKNKTSKITTDLNQHLGDPPSSQNRVISLAKLESVLLVSKADAKCSVTSTKLGPQAMNKTNKRII